MHDPNWFYSTLAQSSAAIVGLAGGFMVTRVLAQRTEIDGDRASARALMLNLHSSTVAQSALATQVQASIGKILPIAENTGQLDISLIQTFSHPGNHGQQGIYAADTDVLKLLTQTADDAKTYQEALDQLAKSPKQLADQLRNGKNPRSHAPEWLNEQLTEGLSGGSLRDTLGQQRQWMRNDWNGRVGQFEEIKLRLASLRTRSAIGSLSALSVYSQRS